MENINITRLKELVDKANANGHSITLTVLKWRLKLRIGAYERDVTFIKDKITGELSARTNEAIDECCHIVEQFAFVKA